MVRGGSDRRSRRRAKGAYHHYRSAGEGKPKVGSLIEASK